MRAVLLGRRGRRDCSTLDAILVQAGETAWLSRRTRAAVAKHMREGDVCDGAEGNPVQPPLEKRPFPGGGQRDSAPRVLSSMASFTGAGPSRRQDRDRRPPAPHGGRRLGKRQVDFPIGEPAALGPIRH